MGKRVNFSARTVITPDPTIDINELGVPIKIATNRLRRTISCKNKIAPNPDAHNLVHTGRSIAKVYIFETYSSRSLHFWGLFGEKIILRRSQGPKGIST